MQLVGVNERGRRVGESHHRARIPDLIVDLIRELHDTGVLGYALIGRFIGVPKATVRDLVLCRRRAQYPVAFRKVK